MKRLLKWVRQQIGYRDRVRIRLSASYPTGEDAEGEGLTEVLRQLRQALDGWRWQLAMEELDQEIRNKAKWNEKYNWTDEEIRDLIREKMEDHKLYFDD